MPQMAPMSWLMLFMFFSIMLLMINMLNYYLFNPKFNIKKSSKNILLKSQNWKW
uniref:ATP synthase complex subunit 8 n=1 Tax=Orthetrum testaceum TaxID=1408535 RepID=A0A1I9NJF8_9ODON|nr:ATP synthase F0 subunit 8 [Orthetrum testaceum]ANX10005.1 ATP synthase F0 subunit 8 [Orthetrum testaceum]